MKKMFKRILAVLLVAVMTIGSAPLSGLAGLELPEWFDLSKLISFKAEAATYSGTCGDNLTWTLDTETGILEINGTGNMTNYTSNKAPWYSYRLFIKTVILCDGVEKIGNHAFGHCDNLVNVTLPNSVKSIGQGAFGYCNSLKEIEIPNTVTDIGIYAFWNSGLTSISLPNSLTIISDGMFQSCNSLISVTLPDNLTDIRYCAFEYCYSLENISIPSSVSHIGSGAFLDCNSLLKIAVDKNNLYYSSDENGVLYDKNKTELIQYPVGNSRTSFIIPNSVTGIEKYAFLNCKNLTSITIPKSITSIGEYTFHNCDEIDDVCYEGSEEEWNAITIGTYNASLTNATIHFNFIPPHGHSYNISNVIAATCTAQGYTTFTCECGDTYTDNYTDALGHSCTSSVTKPTCTEQGYTTYTCTRSGCGYSDIGNYISATGHSYGDWEEIPATCEKSGSRYKVCSACSDKITETIPKLEHEYESVVTPSSCVNEGYTTHTCINCGDDYIDSNTPALGHSYGEWTDETVATCETAGLRYRECSCGDREEITVEPTGHDYVRTVVVAPTHEKDGYSTYVCNNCGNDENRDFVPAEGHSYGEWRIETVATCTKAGLRVRKCSCGDRIEETIEALGHKYTKDSVVSPTCTEKGYTVYICSSCNTTKIDDYVSSKGHSYGDFITETYATCKKEGLKYKECSVCSDRIEEIIEKTEHKYESKTTAPTCTEGGYTTHTCGVCQNNYTDSTVDALGHSYGEWTTEIEATCTNSGLKYQECSLCKDRREEKIPIIEHDYSSSDTEPTCTEKGFTTYTCNVCGYNYNDTYIAALSHTYGEWIIDKEANLLETGSQHRNCTACNETEKQSIPKVEVDIETNTNYGLAVFTVVHAQELTPISGAQIFISTENDGENTFVTDESGQVSVILPVGKQHISVYAGNCLTRNLNITVKSGTTYFPQIGLSEMPVYDAEIDYHEMTLEEIEAAGIDTSNPDNQHVYKYELKLDFVPGIDTSSIIAYFNGSGIYLGGYSGGKEGEPGEPGEPTYTLHYHEYPSKICFTSSCHTVEVEKGRTVSLTYYPESYDNDYTFDGWYEDTALTKEITSVKIEDYNTYVYGHWIREGEEVDPPKPTQGIKIEEDEEIITVYPVSEYFYLIVRGEVTWLKEMFDVEMLVINRSNTDTLEDVKATLTLPDGLSLASMIGKQQSLEQYIGSVPEGETKSVHWYVKGDKEGSYGFEARLQGMVMPFEEPIDDVFVSKNNIQVYAGNALNLHFEFPSAAYYGEDYPITITLTNVSDKPLYNINHMVQIEQGMQVIYSDGTTKKRIETSEWKSIGVEKFNPGDKIIIEASVNIFFESEMMKAQIEKYIGYVDGIEQLLNGYNAVSTSFKAYEKLIKTFSGNIKSINNFMKTKSLDTDKDKLFAQLHNKLSSLYSSYTKSGSKSFDAVFGLANSGVSAALNVITNDPEAWLDKCAEEDITKLIKKISALESSLLSEESETKNFDIFDSIRTAISTIPIVFTLTNVTMTEDENNTTSIPWSYSVSQASPQYFGVSSVSKYLLSIVQMMLGDVYDKNVPGLMQLLVGVDDPFNTDEALEYIKATEKEITQFKAKDATGKVTFKAWIERNVPGNIATISDDFDIASDNDSAKFENGVLTFTGDGMISVQPKNTTGGTLYVEDSEGNVYTYVIDVVEEHECSAGVQQVVIAPTEEYNGFAVKCCETCDEIMKVINLSYANCCTEHNFGDWTTETKATCLADGVETRTCSTCGFVEYEFVAASGHVVDSYEITKEATCTEAGVMTYHCSCGESYTEDIIETGHKFSEWNTKKEATCEEDGLKTAVCTDCGTTGEEVIPMSGHADEDGDGKCDICTQVPESGEDDEEEPIVLESISLASEPTKKKYYLGEALDTSGLKLKLVYSDGSTETVSSGFSTKGFSSTSSGTKTVTVYYSGLKTSFTVEVNTVSISLSESSKSMFIGGTSEISATVNPEDQTVIWASSDENIATVSDGIITAASEGNAVVTASIVVGGKSYSASCTVVVSDPKGVITSVTIYGEPSKTEYYVGDPLNTSGLQLEVTYADGSTEIISSGFATNGFDSSSEGSKVIAVNYGDFTVKYDITVKPAEERKALYSGTCGAEGDNLTWTLYENGQLVIDGIGDMADYDWGGPWTQHQDLIVELVVNDEVTNVGDSAFYECDSLANVTLGENVTNIGSFAFYGCTNIENAIIGNNVITIENSAFDSCSGLTNIIIPNNVTIIGDWAFWGCNSLSNISIGSSVNTIGNQAFYQCDSLTNIMIPKGVTTIGEKAFYGCESITEIKIPDSTTNIGNRAFGNCVGLANISVDKNNAFYSSDDFGVLFNKDKTTLIQYPAGNIKTSYEIPIGTTSIGDFAFENCESLTSVTIPDGVIDIGCWTFINCVNLESAIIPNGVTSLTGVFAYCENLTSVIIPDSVTTIGQAFVYCNKLTNITLPESLTKLGQSAFEHCISLKSIKIPDKVTNIGMYAFSNCNSLINVIISDNITSVDSYAFYKCTSLTDVYFIGSEEEWNTITINSGNDCFENASIHYNYRPLESVSIYTLPNKMTYYINESLDTTGLQLKLHYSDGSTEIVSEGFSITGYSVLKIGDQIVTVSYQGYSDTFTVTSYDRNITLSSKNEKLFVGETTTIIASTTPIDMEVMWSSSNINVATVSDDGVITAKSSGTAIITAELYEVIYNNAYIYDKETCEVVVEEVALASIAVKSNPTKISYYVGDTLNTSGLTLTATYNNDTTKTITGGFTCTPTDLNTVGTQKITVTYGGKTTSFNITVEEVALSDITIKSNPTKTNYYVGDTLDTSGLTLTATYNNGITKTVSDGFSCTPTMFDTVGTQNITVTYGGETTSFSVTVEDIVLTSIAIKNNPAKTSYYVGDTLDTTGIVLTATYNNSKTETVSEGFTCTPTTLETAGTQIITVCYGGETATFNVIVEDIVLSSIAIKSMPDNKSYYVGDSLDTSGLTLIASYNNGMTKTISSDFTCTPTELSTAGTQEITVTYGGKTTSFNITVEDVTLSDITIKSEPTKTNYYVGDTLSTEGLTLTASYNNGTTKNINSGFTCTPEMFTTAGKQEVTVTYGEKTTSFNVTVTAVTVSGISIKTTPSKMLYFVGDNLDTTGLAIIVNYNNGTSNIISSGFICTPTTLNTVGTQQITVIYSGATATFDVDVTGIVASGSCGENAIWTFDVSTNTLTISGTGPMDDYYKGDGDPIHSLERHPWEEYHNIICNVVIENGITTVGKYSFYGCDNLETVVLSDSITDIRDGAFSMCKNLTTVSIPKSVKSIGRYAFNYCTNLKNVKIPAAVTEIGDYAFRYCHGVYVDKDNKCYSSDEYGVLFNKEKTVLIQYPSGCTEESYTIPDGVLTINTEAFYDCDSIKNISIPYGLSCIGWEAFKECDGLTSVTIPDSVTTIEYAAFRECVSLESVILSKNISSIGNYMFYECANLTNITIPKGVTEIGPCVFAGCNKLTDVYYLGTIEQFCAISVGDDNGELYDATIHYLTLDSLSIHTFPIKTSYFVEETFDASGLILTATYSNGKTEIISDGFICTPTTFNTVGTQKITVTYGDKTTTLDVTVEDVVLTGIEVKSNPSKTSYFVGDVLDTSGLTLTATYNNGTIKTVSGGFTCTPEALETAGTQKITITYGDKSTSFDVEVKAVEISGISIANVPETLNYFVGDTLSTEGLAILVTYNNGTTKTVTSGFACTPTVLETEGTQKITVTYGDKTASFNISVASVKVTELEIVTVPEKTSYKVGDKFDPTGLTMNAVNSKGEEIVVREGFVCTPEILDKAGTQVVTVSYGGKSVMITVTVAEAEPETYVVKFVSNGEVISETTYAEGEMIVEPKVSETIGYTFTGWTPQIPDAMPADNLTFTAIWIANSYDAIFDANGGAWADGATEKAISNEYGADIIAPEAPIRDGYVFSGWTPEIGVMDDVNGKTFTAIWSAATDTNYTVETYTMNTSGEYEKSSQTFSGATGELVAAEYTVPKGFTLNAEKSVLEGTITADNSLVLKVYIDRNTYTFTTVVDGVSTPTAYLYGSMVSEPVTPSKTDYKFIKWNGTIPETMPAENVTISAVFEKYYVCPDCGNEILGEAEINEHKATEAKMKATVKIKNNTGSNTIKYGETLRLTAITNNMPADAKIYWYVDGEKKGEGEIFNVSFENGTKTVEVKIVDSNGNVLKNASGNEIKDSESVTVKGGFFQKIISFFKNLFGMNRTVVQSVFKGVF